MRFVGSAALCALALFVAGCTETAHAPAATGTVTPQATSGELTFKNGYPTADTLKRGYDDLDMNRAVEAYRFFYPTVSGAAMFKGNAKIGVLPNKAFGTLDTKPIHVGYTLNSDTPYAPLLLDLKDGPMVVELPAGPLICVAMDINQRWVADLGVPGPAAGKGDKVVFVPPGYTEKLPAGYREARSSSNKMLVGVRSLPVGGDVPKAMALIRTVKVHPLKPTAGWTEPTWADLTPMPQDTTPLAWENNIQYWRELAEVINDEPANPPFTRCMGSSRRSASRKASRSTPTRA